ncbi:MAG: DUF4389 domain-containing protein [Myxococcaceae bacterium]
MTTDYPVTFDVTPPERFARVQLGLRLVLFIAIGIVGFSLGAALLLLYLALPAVAAVSLSNGPAGRYLEQDAPRISRFLRWIIAVLAYFAIVTDRLPTEEPDGYLRFEIRPGGHPTAGSALLRILTGIPSALVLAVLLFFAGFAWVIAFLLVLVQERYPRSLFELQAGVLRWTARLLAYQASLVEPYPPYSLGEHPPAQVHASDHP